MVGLQLTLEEPIADSLWDCFLIMSYVLPLHISTILVLAIGFILLLLDSSPRFNPFCIEIV